jgi:hypothetical protein
MQAKQKLLRVRLQLAVACWRASNERHLGHCNFRIVSSRKKKKSVTHAGSMCENKRGRRQGNGHERGQNASGCSSSGHLNLNASATLLIAELERKFTFAQNFDQSLLIHIAVQHAARVASTFRFLAT